MAYCLMENSSLPTEPTAEPTSARDATKSPRAGSEAEAFLFLSFAKCVVIARAYESFRVLPRASHPTSRKVSSTGAPLLGRL